jgi:glyceraldehyde 3-phosphate dehydrogenase
MGVNDNFYNEQKHSIISLGSCTTNAFIPIVSVLQNEFEIIKGTIKTVHAYTSSQALLDGAQGTNFRRARAAALNIVPTTTGALKMLGKVIPDLTSRFSGLALRVPVGNVSFIDVCVQLKRIPTLDQIHALFDQKAHRDLKGILDTTIKPLVSSDFMQNPHSVVIDVPLTSKIDDQINIFGWYDNEWAYSLRMVEFLAKYG